MKVKPTNPKLGILRHFALIIDDADDERMGWKPQIYELSLQEYQISKRDLIAAAGLYPGAEF